ncbi:MAG: hypothetical protein NDI63_06550 [Pseudobdellovibrio sp.]|nr:hypothetical protein [Pseudobdellovibrio sp.]
MKKLVVISPAIYVPTKNGPQKTQIFTYNKYMTQKRILLFNLVFASFISIYGCVSQDLRLPATAGEVYKNTDLQQSLMMAAQNNILFVISPEALVDLEKTEVDLKCRSFESPFWSEKLSVYLNYMRQHPEYFSRFHVLEIKKGDQAQVQMQKDLDGASVLSIQYVMTEVRGKVTYKTQLPCEGRLAESIGKDIVKTNFEFPTTEDFGKLLADSADKSKVDRFQFANDFLMYLAERGAIFKFGHEQSFEKNSKGQYIMALALNQMSKEVISKNMGYLNLWLKKINQNSRQAELIQMFGLVNDNEIKAGVKVDSQGEFARKTMGQPDLTYLYMTFKLEGDDVKVTSLDGFNRCLQAQVKELGSDILGSFRNPAAKSSGDDDLRDSYLSPGFNCDPSQLVSQPPQQTANQAN